MSAGRPSVGFSAAGLSAAGLSAAGLSAAGLGAEGFAPEGLAPAGLEGLPAAGLLSPDLVSAGGASLDGWNNLSMILGLSSLFFLSSVLSPAVLSLFVSPDLSPLPASFFFVRTGAAAGAPLSVALM